MPTGVLIDSLRFEGGTDFDVRGYIWQRFSAGSSAALEAGLSMTGVSDLEIGEPQADQAGDVEVVRWPFEVSQRVRFENSKYPPRRDRFALRIVPRAITTNQVLVPDLSAYPILSPATRPGLDENVYLPGWQITRTFFELREQVPATDYGLGGSASNEAYPSLYFNIGARQKIAAQEIIYLEYFYIVMYFALLWVAVNSILYVRWPESRFIQHESNLFPKVLFWPVTLGVLWLITLVTFY